MINAFIVEWMIEMGWYVILLLTINAWECRDRPVIWLSPSHPSFKGSIPSRDALLSFCFFCYIRLSLPFLLSIALASPVGSVTLWLAYSLYYFAPSGDIKDPWHQWEMRRSRQDAGTKKAPKSQRKDLNSNEMPCPSWTWKYLRFSKGRHLSSQLRLWKKTKEKKEYRAN